MDRPDGISEKFSGKRGRPPRFDPDSVRILRSLYPEVTTERGLRNCCYLIRAVQALKDDEPVVPEVFSWIFAERRLRRVILYALGKQHWDAEMVREVAREICQRQLRTREALDYIEVVNVVREHGHEWDQDAITDGDGGDCEP